MKQQCPNEKLCEGLPLQFLEYMNYAMSLQFDQPPDFTYLKKLIWSAASDNCIELFDNVFDWSIKLTQPKQTKDNGSNKLIEESKN